MKKILCFAVSVLLLAALSVNCFAAGNLRVSQVTRANANGSFSVDIYLENNPGVQSVTVNLSYDPQYFTVLGQAMGELFPYALPNSSAGILTLSFVGSQVVTQNGKLATVSFFCSDSWTGSAFTQIGVNGVAQTASGQVELANNSVFVNWNLNESDWTLNQDTTLEDEDIWVEDPDNGDFWGDTEPDIEVDEDDEDEDIVIDDDGQVEITVTRETEATTEKTTKTEKTTEKTTKTEKTTERTTEKTTEATTTTTEPTTPAVTTPPSETVTLPMPVTTEGAVEALGNSSQTSSGRATGGTVAASIVVIIVTACAVLGLEFYRKIWNS